MNLRDYLYIAVALGGLGWMGRIIVLADTVGKNEVQVKKIAEVVADHETRLAVSDERWGQIQKELKNISRKLDAN